METKKFIISIVFIFLLISVHIFFPITDVFQKVVAFLSFFVVIPILFNSLILKRKFDDIGLQFGDWKKGLIWSGTSTALIGIIFGIFIYFFGFYEKYLIPASIVNSYKDFILYSITTTLFFVVIYDLFFRGFLMGILQLKIGFWAVVVQAVVFIALAIFAGSVIWTLVPYMIFSLFAGIIVYKSRSIIYSSIMQFIILFLLNAGMIYTLK
ncbi:MAG TPA: CPBP family intramembrane metalloprotease [Candidatus Moranbacteria bacterium]|mgnify:CR=1 FL=1|nr:CPBP family intramembrane metalloprotease [Candidatus Moranbacteria bacterium]